MTVGIAPIRLQKPARRLRGGPNGGGARDTWLLVLPALVPIILFSVIPLLQGIFTGFTDSKAGLNLTVTFTGIDNYVRLLGNGLFWNSFKIGLFWAFGVTILQFFAALGLALLLNMNLRLRWLARTLALVPWAMPPVIVAIMWRLLLNPTYGPINQLIRLFGGNGDINWLGDFALALPVVIVVGVWVGMPQTTITLLAGLQGVPQELNEAAAIDGANTWQRFRHVTLPALRPIIFAITSLDLIWNFNSFGLVYVLTQGGPGGQTMLPMLFAYNEAFKYGQFGYAAAMGNVMVVVIGIFLLVYLRVQARSRP